MPPLYQQIIAISDRFGLNWNDTTILSIVLRYHEEEDSNPHTLLGYVESVASQEASCSDDSSSSSDDSESE